MKKSVPYYLRKLALAGLIGGAAYACKPGGGNEPILQHDTDMFIDGSNESSGNGIIFSVANYKLSADSNEVRNIHVIPRGTFEQKSENWFHVATDNLEESKSYKAEKFKAWGGFANSTRITSADSLRLVNLGFTVTR